MSSYDDVELSKFKQLLISMRLFECMIDARNIDAFSSLQLANDVICDADDSIAVDAMSAFEW